MSAAVIAQLLITYGPQAFELIKDLANIWGKDLTVEEVEAFCDKSKKSYDDYINEAKAKLNPVVS